jgi:hypothetical protein
MRIASSGRRSGLSSGLMFGLPALLATAACGDNHGHQPAPDAPDASPVLRCEVPAAVLPTSGPLADPLALPLEGCLEGGLRDLPGRWFVSTGAAGFAFEYPKFEGSCETGFGRANFPADDHDDSDGRARHTWSDGTRIFLRQYRRFMIPNQPPYELVSASAACLRADGTLSAARATFNNDQGVRMTTLTGKRFAPKDGAPVGLRLLGELGSQNGVPISAYNVVVDGTHAYLAGPLGLDVVDVGTPGEPVHVGHLDGGFNDVRVVRGGGKVVAYGAPLFGMETSIIDVTDPANPKLAGTIPEFSHSLQVQQRGAETFLYLATYTAEVPRYDITNPLTPVRLGAATVPGPESDGVHDLTVDGDRLYVNYTTEGFVAIDVSGGLDAPVELGRYASPYSHASWVGVAGGRPIVLHGDEGMTASGGAYLTVHDADPASPTFLAEIGRYQSRPEVGIHNIQLVGDKAYIAYYQDGVRIVDLSTPTAPREVAHHNTWNEETALGGPFEGAMGIRVVDDKIYVADSERGLLIFEEI